MGLTKSTIPVTVHCPGKPPRYARFRLTGWIRCQKSYPSCAVQLYRSMSKELRDDRRMMRLLSRKTADQRLASFLITLSDRFRRRGYSPYSFRLFHVPGGYRQLSWSSGRDRQPYPQPLSAAKRSGRFGSRGELFWICSASSPWRKKRRRRLHVKRLNAPFPSAQPALLLNRQKSNSVRSRKL